MVSTSALMRRNQRAVAGRRKRAEAQKPRCWDSAFCVLHKAFSCQSTKKTHKTPPNENQTKPPAVSSPYFRCYQLVLRVSKSSMKLETPLQTFAPCPERGCLPGAASRSPANSFPSEKGSALHRVWFHLETSTGALRELSLNLHHSVHIHHLFCFQ